MSLLISFLLFLNFIYTSFYILNWEYSLNWVESNIRFILIGLTNYHSLYGPYENTIVLINTYAPPYYLIVYAISFFIPGIISITGLRIFTLFLELLLGITIAFIVKLELKDKILAIIACLLFLAVISVHKFHGVAKIDYLQILLILQSIYFFRLFEITEKRKYLWVFSLISALSIFTKITAIFTFFLIFLYNTFQKENKNKAIVNKHMLLSGLIFSLLFFVTNALTQNKFFTQTIYYQMISIWDINTAIFFYKEFISTYGALLLLCTIFLVQSKLNSRYFYSFLYFGGLIEIFFTLMKRGADLNYTLLFLSIAIISVSLSFHEKLERLLIFLVLVTLLVSKNGYYYKNYTTPKTAEEIQRIEKTIRFSDDEYLIISDMYIPIKYNRKVLTNDVFQYGINLNKNVQVSHIPYLIENDYIGHIYLHNFSRQYFDIPVNYILLRDYPSNTSDLWEIWASP